tara:strand:- start:2510 stop:3259 length:750 start_codon:yes stop_codon:yes gene_type:complete
MKHYLDFPGIAVLAHRGGALEANENTLESFYYANEIGCDYIETDVQISSDGIPYIFHDEDLSRIVGKKKFFNELSSDEINELVVFSSLKIPTLRSVLESLPDTLFQIDVKTDDVAIPALKVIEECDALHRVCIASFSSSRLEVVRNLYPNICISMGPKEILKTLLASFGLYRKTIPGDCLQVPIYHYGIKIVTQRFIKYVQKKGLKIIVWTINDTKTMERLISMGVDGIITDKPMELKNLLAKKKNLSE